MGREAQHQLYNFRKENGLCTKCGELATEGKTLCKTHAEIVNARNNSYKIKKKKMKLCVDCSTPVEESIRCNKCRSIHIIYMDSRKEQGLCSSCGEIIDGGGVSKCSKCSKKEVERSRNRRNIRRDNGLCLFCDLPVIGIYSLCEYHFLKEQKRRAERDPKLCCKCLKERVVGSCYCEYHLDFFNTKKKYREDNNLCIRCGVSLEDGMASSGGRCCINCTQKLIGC
jgi:hypothetical protein